MSHSERRATQAAGSESLRDGPLTLSYGGHRSDDFRFIRTNLLQRGSACITDRVLLYAVFIDPQPMAVLGTEGGALMALLQLSIIGKLPYDQLRDAVFAHPTLAESLNNLFSTLES